MEDKEPITTTMIVDKDMVDTIIIALNDCKADCQNRVEWATRVLKKDPEKTDSDIIEKAEQIKVLAEFTLEQLPRVFQEIKDIYPELEERSEAQEQQKIITIEKPSWSQKLKD